MNILEQEKKENRFESFQAGNVNAVPSHVLSILGLYDQLTLWISLDHNEPRLMKSSSFKVFAFSPLAK